MFIATVVSFLLASPAFSASAPRTYTFHCFVQTLADITKPSNATKLAETEIRFSEDGGEKVLLESAFAKYLVNFGTCDKKSGGRGFTLGLAIGTEEGNIAYLKTTWEKAGDKTSAWLGTGLAEPGLETGFFCELK
ncbi:hypothetical protein EON80_11945 [bacterium]|nr:MAG: hypothetical protein EON80_11945 [bacterium]